MTTETKRRLLLSKWNGELETLRYNAKQHKRDIDELTDKLDHAESQLKEAEYDLELAREAHVDEIAAMESALVDVKYWMHAAQFRRSWPLLRKVEKALEP
jgi:hypothetical protein